jgi:hypothetical protein
MAPEPDLSVALPSPISMMSYVVAAEVNNHAGNIKFRQMVNKHKLRYLAAKKGEKPKFSKEVVRTWRAQDPQGRFWARKGDSPRVVAVSRPRAISGSTSETRRPQRRPRIVCES